MVSLQAPKKITFQGSDGKEYAVLAKAKDDPRKDARILEFFRLVSDLMRRDTECRKRHMTLRTYCVVPLADEAGLIEWVGFLFYYYY